MGDRNVTTILELGDEYMEYVGVYPTILSSFAHV